MLPSPNAAKVACFVALELGSIVAADIGVCDARIFQGTSVIFLS